MFHENEYRIKSSTDMDKDPHHCLRHKTFFPSLLYLLELLKHNKNFIIHLHIFHGIFEFGKITPVLAKRADSKPWVIIEIMMHS